MKDYEIEIFERSDRVMLRVIDLRSKEMPSMLIDLDEPRAFLEHLRDTIDVHLEDAGPDTSSTHFNDDPSDLRCAVCASPIAVDALGFVRCLTPKRHRREG